MEYSVFGWYLKMGRHLPVGTLLAKFPKLVKNGNEY